MIIYCERGDLLDELKEVDGAVEKGWFEFAFKVDVVAARFVALNIVGEVDEGDNVNRKLAENGANDVRVEDIRLGSFFGETLDGLFESLLVRCSKVFGGFTDVVAYLCARDGEEADAHKHAADCYLAVAKFDAFQVQHAKTVRADQAV